MIRTVIKKSCNWIFINLSINQLNNFVDRYASEINLEKPHFTTTEQQSVKLPPPSGNYPNTTLAQIDYVDDNDDDDDKF